MDAVISTFISPGPVILEVGPFILRWYGLLIAIAVLFGLNISSKLAKQRGLEQNLISDLLPILVLTSIIGARLYYVIFNWRYYKYNLFESLAIWEGGIAIHGAIFAGTMTVLFFCRIRRQAFWDVLDVLLPSVAFGQSIGRWGNFFNNEAFGVPTELPWKLFIPEVSRPTIFANYDYFHPTFLYESLWNLAVFALLIFLFQRGIKGLFQLPPGAISCTYLISYSLGRIWIEGLRVDSLCIAALPPFCTGGLRVAQVISLVLIALGSIGLWYIYRRKKQLPGRGRSKTFQQ